MKMKEKIFYKILAMIIIPLVIVSSTLSITFYFTIRDEIISEKIDDVSQMMVFVSQDLANSLYYSDVDRIDEIVNRISQTSGITAVYVFDIENQLLATNLSKKQLSENTVDYNFLENGLLSNEVQTAIKGDVLQISHPIKITDKLGTMSVDWTLNKLSIAVNNLLLMLLVL